MIVKSVNINTKQFASFCTDSRQQENKFSNKVRKEKKFKKNLKIKFSYH